MDYVWSKNYKELISIKGKLSHKEWKRIFKKVPRICVDLVIKDRRDIVLAKRENTYGSGEWNLPGGHIFFGEAIEHAVKRKAREETGLNVEIVKFIGVYDYKMKSGFGRAISLCFLCRPIGGKLHGYKYGHDVRFFKKLPKIGFTQINIIRGKGMLK